MLISQHCQEIRDSFKHHSKSATWLSPSLQNEIIHFLANEVQEYIKKEIHEAKYFTVLADKTKDISKREQLSIDFRYVHGFKIIERFRGYTLVSELTARALADYILQKISCFSLDLNYLVSQSYDGASVMSGCNS